MFYLRAELEPHEGTLPLELRTVLSSVYADRGGARYQSGEETGAVEDFKKAVKINPDNWRAHLNLGQLAVVDGRKDDAMMLFAAALKGAKDNSEAQSTVKATMERLGL